MDKISKTFFKITIAKTPRKFSQQKKKFEEGKKRNILFVVNDKGQFSFLDQEIENPGVCSIYQYVSETFYALLVNTNKRLNEIYSTWYDEYG